MVPGACFMIEHEDELTRLLFTASIHYLHTTIEILPIGQIEICEQGIITTADKWTESTLGYAEKGLCGKNLCDILGAGAFILVSLFQNKEFDTVRVFEFLTIDGSFVSTKVVLVPPIENYKLAFYVIFMKSNTEQHLSSMS